MKKSEERRWSEEDKRAVCREAVEGTDPVAHVAKRHGIRKARLYYWLKDARYNPTLEGQPSPMNANGFVSLSVVEKSVSRSVAVHAEPTEEAAKPISLEISLAGGHQVFLSGGVSAEVIAQVLRELRS